MPIYVGGNNITGGFTAEEKKQFNDSINSINEQLDNNVQEVNNLKATKANVEDVNKKANQTDLEIQKSRIDSFTSLQQGSTSGDAELIDGRIGGDGVTYSNIGEAIRSQNNYTKYLDMNVEYVDNSTLKGVGHGADVGGLEKNAKGYKTSKITPLRQDITTIVIKNYEKNLYLSNIAFYSSNVVTNTKPSNLVGYFCAGNDDSCKGVVPVPQGAKYFIVACDKSKTPNIYLLNNDLTSQYLRYNDMFDEIKEKVEIHLNNPVTPTETNFIIEYFKNKTEEIGVVLGDTGKWYNPDNGRIETNPYVGNKIKPFGFFNCKSSTKYICNFNTFGINFYDVNKVHIKAKIEDDYKNKTFTTPSNASYFTINVKDETSNWNNDYINSFKVLEGDTIADYYTEIPTLKINNEPQRDLIKLASSYNAVVGDRLEIFIKSIIDVTNIDDYYVEFVASSKGNKYRRRWIYTPKATDTDFTLEVRLFNKDRVLICNKQTLIKVVNAKVSPSTPKNILCVGDSLTNGGVWVKELNRRLTATSGNPIGNGLQNISFVGTQGTNVMYEGRGGWTWNDYLTSGVIMYWVTVTSGMKDNSMQQSVWSDGTNQWTIETVDATNNRLKLKRTNTSGDYTLSSSGTLTYISGASTDTTNIVYNNATTEAGNPFWNPSTSQIDFDYYLNKIGKTTIDYALFLLGWNSVLCGNVDVNITQGKLFIDKLHAKFPECKVIMSGIQIPSEDGWGNNYGVMTDTSWFKQYKDLKNYVYELNQKYELWTKESNYTTFMNYSDFNAQFDSEYGYPTVEMNVNNRSTTKEIIQSNCVHPSTEGEGQVGQNQLADSMYRALYSLL